MSEQFVPALDATIYVKTNDILSVIYEEKFWKSIKDQRLFRAETDQLEVLLRHSFSSMSTMETYYETFTVNYSSPAWQIGG